MKIAVYPGSFDPITSGHLEIIERTSLIFDKVIVLIAINTNKKSTFTTEEKMEMIQKVTKHLNNVEIIPIEDVVTTKQHYDRECWEQGARDIKQAIGRPIDIVYCGTGYEDSQIFETLYPESEVKYFDRTFIPI